MSFLQKNLDQCKNLSNDKIKLLADKVNLKINEKINKNNKERICNQITKIANNIDPCGIILHNDTDIILKKHQLSVSNQLVHTRGIIVVHSVGTGKTLTAISTAQCLLNKKLVENIIVITPTSLQKNFIKQAIQYGLNQLEIDKKYTFYTIQGIVNLINLKKISKPLNSLIIIDEAHNLRTYGGSRFESISEYTKKASKILLLTATQLINYSSDIINLISLATGNEPITHDNLNFMIEKKNKTEFKEYIKNIFNFYIKNSLIHDNNYPDKKILEIFLPMEKNYLKIYERIEKGQELKIEDFKNKNIQVFYNGLRRASNIIEKKSPKVEWIKNKIYSEPNLKYVIFSNFINMGIMPVMSWLNENKINYAHVTGDLSIEKRDDAVNKFNSDEIKVLFISKAGSEGLDLKNTRCIIIMESGWNENSMEQIIGRGVRYKSHSTLPKSKQNVTIYRLYAVKPEEYKNIRKITNKHLLEYNASSLLSVDLYLRNYSWLKQQELNIFEKMLIKYSNK